MYIFLSISAKLGRILLCLPCLFRRVLRLQFLCLWFDHVRLLLAVLELLSCREAGQPRSPCAFGSTEWLQRRLTPSVLFSLAPWGWQRKHWLHLLCSQTTVSILTEASTFPPEPRFPLPPTGGFHFVVCNTVAGFQDTTLHSSPCPPSTKGLPMQQNSNHESQLRLCLFKAV